MLRIIAFVKVNENVVIVETSIIEDTPKILIKVSRRVRKDRKELITNSLTLRSWRFLQEISFFGVDSILNIQQPEASSKLFPIENGPILQRGIKKL